MASGDTLFVLVPQMNQPPSSNYATLDTITAVTGLRWVLDFDGSAADETAIFPITWPSHYDGGGITLVAKGSTDGTSTGDIQLELSVEKTVQGSDLDATGGADFGTATDVTDTPSGTADQKMVFASGAITHANCGSPAAGDSGRLKVTRDYDHASNTDDFQFEEIYVTET